MSAQWVAAGQVALAVGCAGLIVVAVLLWRARRAHRPPAPTGRGDRLWQDPVDTHADTAIALLTPDALPEELPPCECGECGPVTYLAVDDRYVAAEFARVVAGLADVTAAARRITHPEPPVSPGREDHR